MDEKKAKELTDSIFDKLNDQERVYLAWVHNQKNKEIEKLNNIIKRFEEDLREVYLTFGEFSEEYTEKKIRELKGDDKE